jgi:hypothetical protein
MLVLALTSLALLLTQSISLSQVDRGKKPKVAQPAKLTKAQVDKIKGGMTLAEVMALLGRRAEINPDPAPFGYAEPEVLILWREGKGRRVGVVFVPDKQGILRVLDTEMTGGTNIGFAGLPDK